MIPANTVIIGHIGIIYNPFERKKNVKSTIPTIKNNNSPTITPADLFLGYLPRLLATIHGTQANF